jgi:hypothetical protein
MSLKSLFTKGVALAQSGKSRNHSQRASNYAKKAMSNFRSAKSKKGEQKIDMMIDGMNHLSNAVLEVSDTITPIANMNAVSALLAENIQSIIADSQDDLINKLKKNKH